MSKGLYFVTFAAGAVIGFAAAYKYVSDKFDRILQEEVKSVKKTFESYYEKKFETEKQQEREEYSEIVESNNYTTPVEDIVKDIEPYVISPDQYGEIEGYTLVGLTYFNDGVLADDYGDKIIDKVSTVGADFADHFGEYEDDSVHIRNELKMCDYEILMDVRNYSEVYRNRK